MLIIDDKTRFVRVVIFLYFLSLFFMFLYFWLIHRMYFLLCSCAAASTFITNTLLLLLVQDVQLKSEPYFNMSNLFTKIYGMLYYTINLYLQ
jgi:hypothetical protein